MRWWWIIRLLVVEEPGWMMDGFLIATVDDDLAESRPFMEASGWANQGQPIRNACRDQHHHCESFK